MRVGEVAVWLAVLGGCAPDDVVVTGRVLRDGEAAPGVDVRGGGVSTRSDEQGSFRLAVPGDVPAVVAVAEDGATADLSCAEEVELELGRPARRPTGTLALVLRRLPEAPELHVRFTVVEGTEREPLPVPYDVAPGPWVQDGPTTWTGAVEVPATGRWALTVTSLRDERVGGATHHVVDQVLAVGGDALAPGEVRYLEAYMSDETLRERVYWDSAGPGGVWEATFLQRVEVQGIGVDLVTWRGPAERPIPVPAVQIVPGDPLLGFRGEFAYGPADDCAERRVAMDGTLRDNTLPERLVVPGSTSDERVPVRILSFPEPFPPPPAVLLDVDGGLGWSFVPLEPATLSLDLQGEGGFLRGSGLTGCAERRLDLAMPGAGGRFGWERPGQRGWCVLEGAR